ncbi:four-carbon acid sugar kinase family protein [Mucilaginibacter sp.]
MIAVIADDLTGAAEIGGLALKYNLKIELTTKPGLNSNADVLVICTDTRSMPLQNALKVTEQITEILNLLKPDVIFKKTDSVLRGHIIPELKIHLQKLGLKKALLIAPNPQFGRIIKQGQYFINDQPVHLTSFAHDPEFSMSSNKIHAMLRVKDGDIYLTDHTDELPDTGIIVGNCETKEDLAHWVNQLDTETLLAGGAGIFKAFLKSLNISGQISSYQNNEQIEPLKLFVCGTTHDDSRQLVKKVAYNEGPISYMPKVIIATAKNEESLFDNWANEIVSLLKIHKKAIVAIDENTTRKVAITAADLRDKKARVIEKVFQKIAINELLVEGGSTAAAIINRLNFNKFSPVAELGPGVIKMKVEGIDDLFLTLKPGSYQWPANTWNF